MGKKIRLEDLAVFGGDPAFREPLHVGRPNIPDREHFLEQVDDILDSRWLTNRGRYVQKFEQRIAEYLGVKHCIAVTNATLGLALLAGALDLTGEVIMPSLTFPATAHALRWQKLTPIFSDVDPRTHNIDPDQVVSLITPQTSAILGVHLWGRPCDTDALETIARDHHLVLYYDAAHAFGCTHQGVFVGNFGSAEVFSFHATKYLNTFEGGAITTNGDDLAERLRFMKNFGMNENGDGVLLGFNAKMTEISAAMGLTGMENIDYLIQKNLENYQVYQEGLDGVDGIRLIEYNEQERGNFQFIIVEIASQAACQVRDLVMETLHVEGVLAKRYFYPGCHRIEPYKSESSESRKNLVHTDNLTSSLLALPTGEVVTGTDIRTICDIIRICLHNFDEFTGKIDTEKSAIGMAIYTGC